ncbi:hypothetical protein ACFFRR_005870 [Megaselia abdita]
MSQSSKYVSITPNHGIPRAVAMSPAMSTSSDELLSVESRGKKRRLDHLTWEEKVQRKKLKNRVAAQTSRDRKKAKMEDMEVTIQELNENTDMLRNKCEKLEQANDNLVQKNKELEKQVAYLQNQLDGLKTVKNQSEVKSSDCVKSETKEFNLKGSAVSTENPLPKGNLTLLDSEMTEYSDSLWKIIALCLLYKTCSTISTKPNLKSLPKAYSAISSQTWKQAIAQAIKLLPKVKAQNSNCLDQWWGPQQSSWNPAEIHQPTVSA